MIIHITSELVNEIGDIENNKEKALFNEFLTKLLESGKEGKHIISISKRDLRILQKYEWILEENKKRLNLLDSIRNKMFQNLQNLINKIEPSDIVMITYDKSDENESNNINYRYMPFFKFMDLEAFQKSTIVSEHIGNDGVIYEKFFPEIYKQFKKLPFDFYLRKEMGGGNPIFSVLEERCKERFPGFYLFISDSDKNVPSKSGNGTTAKTLLKAYNKCKRNENKNILKFKIYILKVRELENLIPLVFLQEYCENFYKNYKLLIERDVRVIDFMDIKKGIYCYENKNISIVNMSQNKYGNYFFINSISDCDISLCNNQRNFFCKLLKDAKLDFFNEKNKCEKLLKEFQNYFYSSLEKLVDIVLNQCQYELIKNNWIEIGKIIYSWGVGIGRNSLHM